MTGQPKLSQLIAAEAAVFRYGLFGWIFEEKASTGRQLLFTSHRTSAQVAFLMAVMVIVGIETAALHLLMAQWSVGGAWFLTAVSVYSLLFLIAETIVTVHQPLFFDGQTVYLRFGLRWRMVISQSNIERIERISENPPKRDELLTGPATDSAECAAHAARTGLGRRYLRHRKDRQAGCATN